MPKENYIKIPTNLFSIFPEGDECALIWLKFLCLAGACDDKGKVYITPKVPHTPKTLAEAMGRPVEAVKRALRRFLRYGLAERTPDGFYAVRDWEEMQGTDGMERVREQNRIRKQRQRQKERMTGVSRDSHVTVTGEKAKEKRSKKETEKENINTHTNAGAPAGESSNGETAGGARPLLCEVVSAFRGEHVRYPEAEANAFMRYNSERAGDFRDWRLWVHLWSRRAEKVNQQGSRRSAPFSSAASSSFDADEFFSAALARAYGTVT